VRRDRAANRERILLAAEEVFGSGGAGASTEEIARRANVGIATVFRHFATKQDLIEATVVRFLNHLEALARRFDEEPDPGRAFASLMRFLVSTGATKLALATLLQTDGDGLTGSVTTASRDFQEAVGQVLGRAQAAGVARSDATVDDVFVLTSALARVSAPDKNEAVDRALRIVLDGLRP